MVVCLGGGGQGGGVIPWFGGKRGRYAPKIAKTVCTLNYLLAYWHGLAFHASPDRFCRGGQAVWCRSTAFRPYNERV